MVTAHRAHLHSESVLQMTITVNKLYIMQLCIQTVEWSNPLLFLSAMSHLNGQRLHGRVIRVTISKPKSLHTSFLRSWNCSLLLGKGWILWGNLHNRDFPKPPYRESFPTKHLPLFDLLTKPTPRVGSTTVLQYRPYQYQYCDFCNTHITGGCNVQWSPLTSYVFTIF